MPTDQRADLTWEEAQYFVLRELEALKEQGRDVRLDIKELSDYVRKGMQDDERFHAKLALRVDRIETKGNSLPAPLEQSAAWRWPLLGNGSELTSANGDDVLQSRACPECKALSISDPLRCNCGFREVPKVITLASYSAASDPVPADLITNANELIVKVNSLLQEIGISSVTITSGYRSAARNAAIGGAANSRHCFAQAIDLADNSRIIGLKLAADPDKLKKRGCAMEALSYTVRANGDKWVHIQSTLPNSGRCIFQPYAGPPVLK